MAADLSYGILQQADFGNTDLRTAEFSGANLSGARFTGADMRGADLKNASGITDASSWWDANIANVRGIPLAVRNRLLGLGAISIANDKQWQAYKKEGRPHGSWQRYSGNN